MSNVVKKETESVTPVTVAPPSSSADVGIAPDFATTIKSLFRNDFGFIPVLATLIIIAIFFEITSGGAFFKAQNLSNLVLQTITTGTLAIGAALVLLLGEIDLSLAAVSGTCAAVLAVLVSPASTDTSRGFGLNPFISIIAALLVGALIGLINGFFIAVLRVPAFIVTLAGSIGYAGLLLVILGPNSTLKINDDTINNIASTYLPSYLGIGLCGLVVLLYIASQIINRQNRLNAGLRTKTPLQLGIQFAIVIIVVGAVVTSLQSYNGVPLGGVILMALVLFFWLVLTRTSFGRHIYAIGGNAEASRRAGINVTGLKITIFVLASTLAAASGVLEASRERAAPAAIPSTLLLDAIAAAVIGGVSLFGGRGSIWAILLGSLIIKSLENGLVLLNQSQSVVEIVQGSVLVFAVTIDAVLRRGNAVRR